MGGGNGDERGFDYWSNLKLFLFGMVGFGVRFLFSVSVIYALFEIYNPPNGEVQGTTILLT